MSYKNTFYNSFFVVLLSYRNEAIPHEMDLGTRELAGILV